jgi:dephospho-CoA kinase
MTIGITGTDGAGKGTVVDYLVTNKGFTHYSSREFIVAEIDAQGLERTRNQMRLTANEMRATFGDDVVVKKAYERAAQEGKEKVVIESIRATAEALYLKEKGGILLAVDADQHVRFERVQSRRSDTDQVSFEQFVAHEELEKNDPDPHGMQKAAVIAMADYTINNDGDLETLYRDIDKFLATYHG